MTTGPTFGRRAFLGGTAAVLGGLAGCTAGAAGPTVSVLAAGSLQSALTGGLAPAVDAGVEVEAFGSARAARMIAEGQRDPDIVALADTLLFQRLLGAPWYSTFATNALVVAYTEETSAGRAIGRASRWFEPLLGHARLGRTDPDLDPLGYRTLFALSLAEDHYGRPGLASRLLDGSRVYPETQLLAQFETGGVDAALVYRSMAVERGYPYRDLPAAIDLSDPARADAYERTDYRLPDGTVARGGVIRYGARLRSPERAPARRIFLALIEPADDYLQRHGFVVPDDYPHYHGDVPDSIGH